MHLSASAIVVAARQHGETASIARVLTEEHGLVAGYVAGGRGRQLRPVLIPGNRVAAELSAATGRSIRFTRVPVEAFTAGMLDAGVAQDEAELVTWLFTEILDGRNTRPQDGVQRALGRAPRDFGEYARTTAAAGVWA